MIPDLNLVINGNSFVIPGQSAIWVGAIVYGLIGIFGFGRRVASRHILNEHSPDTIEKTASVVSGLVVSAIWPAVLPLKWTFKGLGMLFWNKKARDKLA